MLDHSDNNKKKTELVDLTPSNLRCTVGACPAVFQKSNGELVIIGKKLPDHLQKELESKIGDDEWAIVIASNLLDKALTK